MKPNDLKRKSQRGSALLEFAICSVMLLLITCGVTDFSRMFFILDMATGAAAAGTQYGALSPVHWSDYAGMQTAALNDTGNYPGATAVAVQQCYCSLGGTPASCPVDCSTPLTYVQVRVTIPYSPVFSYPMIPHVTSISSVSTVGVQ